MLLWSLPGPAAQQLLAHLRQAVDCQRATDDASYADGPRYQMGGETAEALSVASFIFPTDGVGQQLLKKSRFVGLTFPNGLNGAVSFKNILWDPGTEANASWRVFLEIAQML